MRILFLCHRIPYPPDKGDKIRAFHELRGMAAAGHEVDVFTLADDPADLVHRSALGRHCRRLTVSPIHPKLARLKALPYFLTPTALTLPYFYSEDLAREIRKALRVRSYDRVFVYSSAMAQYVDWDNAYPVVTDLVDVDSDKWTQYAKVASFPYSAVYRREGRALREHEREVCRNSSAVVVTTGREACLVREIWADAPVHVIPNGVDTAYFNPKQLMAGANASVAPRTITFVGDMSYFPNEEAASYFARSVLPLIRVQATDARFLIVGRNPSRHVRDLSRIGGVTVTGSVPDVRPYLARTHVSVAPFSIASGIQNKILEALACGVPVVATARAVQGMAPEVAAALDTAENAKELASKVLTLLADPQLARRRGLEGSRLVTEGHNWERSLDSVLQLLNNPKPRELSHAGVPKPAR